MARRHKTPPKAAAAEKKSKQPPIKVKKTPGLKISRPRQQPDA